MSEKLRICNTCLSEKNISEFNNRKYICKECDSIKLKKEYKQNKIDERRIYREKLKILCLNDGVTDEEFNKYYIPFEKFEIMKKLPELFSICQCKEITKMDKQLHKLDYNEKLFLDVAYIFNNKLNEGYRINII